MCALMLFIVFRCQINYISTMHMCICCYNGSLSALFRRRPISQGKFCLCKTVEHGDPPQRHPAALQTAGEQHICHTLPVRVCVCVKAKMSFHRGRELTPQHLLLLSKTLNSYS